MTRTGHWGTEAEAEQDRGVVPSWLVASLLAGGLWQEGTLRCLQVTGVVGSGSACWAPAGARKHPTWLTGCQEQAKRPPVPGAGVGECRPWPSGQLLGQAETQRLGQVQGQHGPGASPSSFQPLLEGLGAGGQQGCLVRASSSGQGPPHWPRTSHGPIWPSPRAQEGCQLDSKENQPGATDPGGAGRRRDPTQGDTAPLPPAPASPTASLKVGSVFCIPKAKGPRLPLIKMHVL